MGDEHNFEDLIRNPMKVNKKLEAAVAAWEESIADLSDEQEKFASSRPDPSDPSVQNLIVQIRQSPDDYLSSEDPSTKALAEKAVVVHLLKAEIDRLHTRQNLNGDTIASENAVNPLHDPSVLAVNSEGLTMTVITRESGAVGQSWSRMVGAIASRWTTRRKDISLLQGVLKVEESNGELTKVKVKPSWPEWLVDTSYDVLKRSNYGKLQRRVLKLTQYHILNVRNGSEITKSFKYADITDIFLREQNSFVITVKLPNSGLKSLVYFTSVAVHIVDQITTRLKVTRELDKIGYSQSSSIPDSLVGYSIDVTAHLISDIMVNNAHDNVSDLVSFAILLGELAKESSVGDNLKFRDSSGNSLLPRDSMVSDSNQVSRSSETGSALPRRPSKTRRPSVMQIRDGRTADKDVWTDRDSSRLIAFKENSNELALQKKIQFLMCDSSTAEFATRHHFADSFSAEGKSLADVRMAIDGIYDVSVTLECFIFTSLFNSLFIAPQIVYTK
jgi:hypothetical protein